MVADGPLPPEDEQLAILYRIARKAAKRHTPLKIHDQEDAAQHAMVEGLAMLRSGRDPATSFWYAQQRVRWGVVEYVRGMMCGRRRNRVTWEQLQDGDDLPDEQWRRDLLAIEAQMDFDAWIARLERRHFKKAAKTGNPHARILQACGGLGHAHLATGISRDTLLLHSGHAGVRERQRAAKAAWRKSRASA